MIYKRFTISILIQIILIGITPILFLYTLNFSHLVFTKYFIVLVWIAQIVVLFNYINKTNKDLAKFFLAFKYKDSTLHFDEKKQDSSFDFLHKSFNKVISAFSDVKIEKEKEFIFYNTIVEHVSIGLIAFDESGKIKLINNKFSKLLNLENKIHHINELKNKFNSLPELLKNIVPEKSELIKINIKDQILPFSLKADILNTENKILKLVSFQNIKNEMDQNEMEAWQKLIRIFTHEIGNSISPISLLSSSLISEFSGNNNNINLTHFEQELVEDTLMALAAINKRSKALIKFVDDYKKLTHIPIAKFETIHSKEFINNILILMKMETKKENININTDIEECYFLGDENLLTLVVINLIKNAKFALMKTKYPEITIRILAKDKSTKISVSDNGKGIATEEIDNIFIPFYTTRKEGTGIGLSLSRQIMRQHNGTISVKSELGKGSSFTLKL